MSQLAIICIVASFLIGGALGLRFRVFVIVPASLVAVIVAAVVALSDGERDMVDVIVVIMSAVALQVGYLVGAIIAAIIALNRSGQHAHAREHAAAPGRKVATFGTALTVLAMTGAALPDMATAQEHRTAEHLRLRAPIGHRQPWPQDLPAGSIYQRDKTPAERARDRKLIICRGC